MIEWLELVGVHLVWELLELLLVLPLEVVAGVALLVVLVAARRLTTPAAAGASLQGSDDDYLFAPTRW